MDDKLERLLTLVRGLAHEIEMAGFHADTAADVLTHAYMVRCAEEIVAAIDEWRKGEG